METCCHTWGTYSFQRIGHSVDGPLGIWLVPFRTTELMWVWGDNKTLVWRHNGRDGVSNRQPHDCLLNRSFRRRLKKTSKLCVTGLCAGNLPVTGEFPAQMSSNAENVSIWWRHHESRNAAVLKPKTNNQTFESLSMLVKYESKFMCGCHIKLNHALFMTYLSSCLTLSGLSVYSVDI